MKTAFKITAIFAFAALVAGTVPAAKIVARGETAASVAADPGVLLDRLGTPREEYAFESAQEVAYGTVYRFSEVFRSVPVFGRGLNIAVDKEGNILFANGNGKKISRTGNAVLSPEDAVSVATDGEAVSCRETVYTLGERDERAFEIVTADGGGTRAIVSAESGELLFTAQIPAGYLVSRQQTNAKDEPVELGVNYLGESGYFLADPLRNITVYDCGNTTYRFALYRSNTGSFSDKIAVSIYEAAVRAYDFYADPSNIGTAWRGINGKNDDVEDNASAHGEISLEIYAHYDVDYENANCGYDPHSNSALMYVGDGSKNGVLYRQGKAIDVVAHEYQHAVTDFAVSGGLVYLNESGALDEAISDLFGALIEGYDPSDERFWTCGEDAVTEGADCIRSSILPSDGQRINYANRYPACYRAHYHNNCDNGGVHLNSTIVSHALYKMWAQAPGYFTRQRLGTLCFSALCALTQNATFAEFARVLRQTAEELGAPDEALRAIEYGFFSSGIPATGNTHLVTFYDGDGRVVDELTVRHGEAAIPPSPPVKPSTETHDYEFAGWEGDFGQVTRDTSVRATYRETERRYAVSFYGADGALLKRELVPYGGAATPPSPPQKAPDPDYDYVFDLWDTSYGYITGDTEVRPVYTAIRCHTVRFFSDGTQIAEMRVRDGETADPPPAPEKESTERVSYRFERWEGLPYRITEDVAAVAVFSEIPRTYTVRYVLDGTPCDTRTARYGDPVPLSDAAEEWYLDEALTVRAEGSVSGDLTLYAKTRKPIPIAAAVAGGVAAFAVAAAGIVLFLKKRKRPRQK